MLFKTKNARTRDAVDRASVLHLCFFFFLRFAPTRLDSRRTGLIRPESGRISHIGQYRPATDTAETGRNRPKSAVKIAGEAEILASDAFLALFFLCFVNQVY